ncbi:MAG: ATP-binding cassette domain-containing protein [Bacilli bacterium]|nr:ATP-binding cassette domain-containing protein [Bacilli bacterium]
MASILLKHIYKEYTHSKKESKKIVDQELSPFAVRDFNLEIKDGEFVVLVGPSGCGKSTTLRMIAGLEDITGGELYIGDVYSNNVDASKRDIAMVFQNYALYPHMNSYQNMSYGLKLRKIPKVALDKEHHVIYTVDKARIKELKKQIKEAKTPEEVEPLVAELEKVENDKSVPKMKMVHYSKQEIDEKVKRAADILDITHLLDRKPSDMSGGQRQRVALGRALVRDPKVFLLDEPLSNLDAKLRASMRSEIVKLHKRVKTTFVYVTHDQVEAMTMGDRIVVMKDGIIQQVGTPSEIYDHPFNTFVAGFIGTPQMNFFEVKFKAGSKDVLITLPNSKEVKLPLKELEDIKDEYIDGSEKELVLGVRGEHIVIGSSGVEATVSFVEILGNTTNILCKLDDSDIEFNVTVQERSELNSGDKVKVSFSGKNVHLFDKESGRTIYKFDLEGNKDEK